MEPSPHPADASKRPSLRVFMWRYLTGNHLDGTKRTNATWFTRGYSPSHHLTWWSMKPRFHRMLWRWAIVIAPAAWIVVYHYSPSWDFNLTYIITIAWLPYIIHHGLLSILDRLPRHTLIFVRDSVQNEDVDDSLDDVAIPEMLMDGNAILGNTIATGDDIDVPQDSRPMRRRS